MTIFVKPKTGLPVRDPGNGMQFLPVEGKEVPKNSYWCRRVAAGDVVLVESVNIPEPLEARAAKPSFSFRKKEKKAEGSEVEPGENSEGEK